MTGRKRKIPAIKRLNKFGMKTKLELLEMLTIELALMSLKSNETSVGERQRINHILGDLQYSEQSEQSEQSAKRDINWAIREICKLYGCAPHEGTSPIADILKTLILRDNPNP